MQGPGGVPLSHNQHRRKAAGAGQASWACFHPGSWRLPQRPTSRISPWHRPGQPQGVTACCWTTSRAPLRRCIPKMAFIGTCDLLFRRAHFLNFMNFIVFSPRVFPAIIKATENIFLVINLYRQQPAIKTAGGFTMNSKHFDMDKFSKVIDGYREPVELVSPGGKPPPNLKSQAHPVSVVATIFSNGYIN